MLSGSRSALGAVSSTTSNPATDPEALLSRLGFELLNREPIQWKRVQSTPLLLVDTDKGKLVLKLRTPPAGPVARLKRSIADLELPTQAKVYRSLAGQSFNALRFPGLVHTDGRDYLLLEYVETRRHEEHEVPRRQLLESLFEFQTADLRLSWSGLAVLVAASRKPYPLLVRRLLTGFRKRYGWPTARLALEKAARCRKEQPVLSREFLCHNDFHHNNLLIGQDGTLYLSDFEAVTREDRWVLADIIHFAVGTQEFRIESSIITQYHRLFVERTGLPIDLAAQVRFGLLSRVSKLVLSKVPNAQAVGRYEAFLREVLLDDTAYGRWFEQNFRVHD